MKKSELFKLYEKVKNEDICFIFLMIHVPSGGTDIICHHNAREMIADIDKRYDDNLVHLDNSEVYIIECDFLPIKTKKTFDFGKALQIIKKGGKVARKGWNGKDQFVYYVPANKYKVCTEAGLSCADENGMVEYNHYMALKTVSGKVSTWVPSVTDCLAEDWYEL